MYKDTSERSWTCARPEGSGSQPRWRGDGKELFYVAPDGMLMAVGLETVKGALQVGVPQRLFATRMPSLDAQFDNHYSVTADGQRFLVTTRLVTSAFPLTVVTNWSAAQKRE